ncbi:hypothetical protein COB57_03700 [Candidatus Peregrinibacteria bacterium]|nr:MAG: hypothetical protein COB57_03700 [Candidatus Peregrinibacteria bacterium]
MEKTCKQCSAHFIITKKDQDFYTKVSPVFQGQKYQIPTPSLCPDCRQQRRLAFRNERNLYHRKCSLSNQPIISIYSSDKNETVYAPAEWRKDHWDAIEYGITYDFTEPFFEQMNDLFKQVPKIAIWNINGKNADYNHCAFDNTNCHMNFNTDRCQDSSFGYRLNNCQNTIDCSSLKNSSDCYECLDSNNIQQATFSQNCQNSKNIHHCLDCTDCKNCFACVGLNNKQFYIFNTKYTEKDWNEEMKKINQQPISEIQKNIESLKKDAQLPSLHNHNATNCSGNFIFHGENCKNCFDIEHGKNLTHMTYAASHNSDCMDGYACGFCENSYEITSGEKLKNSSFILWIDNGPHDSMYCIQCIDNCSNLFACVGLKNKQYCIFNKQYTETEYNELVPKIINHMKETGEWGEFFPIEMSPFGYNETTANDYYPLSKQQVQKKQWKWHTDTSEQNYFGKKYIIPENIEDTDENICQHILSCEINGQLYKITPQEFLFYKKWNINIPRICPEQRYKERQGKRTIAELL